MKFAVLHDKKDQASNNIISCLKEHFLPQMQIIELAKESIHSENIDKQKELENFDFLIFATKHQSKENRNTLSLHAPGNWRNADYGGKPGKICKTSALALKYLFQKMQENKEEAKLNYELTLECTHHGPLIENLPCLFIEIGTTQEQWQDKEAGKVIAKTIADFQHFQEYKTRLEKENKKIKSCLAIGGPHYAPNFSKIQLSTKSNLAIGHIIPEYALPLSETMIAEVINKTQEHLDLILLDWKGCGNSESRNKILEILNKTGISHERTERIEK